MSLIQKKECSSDDEEEFYFESPRRYNPKEKAPFLSPKTPQYDKFNQKAERPLRFHLLRTRPFPATPQPKRTKGINIRNNENISSPPPISVHSDNENVNTTVENNNHDASKIINETPKCVKLENPSTTGHYAFTPTPKKNPKKFRTIKTNGANQNGIIKEVNDEFEKLKKSQFIGDIVFILKGITRQSILDETKKNISDIAEQRGYKPSTMSNLSSTVYCEMKPLENPDTNLQTPQIHKNLTVSFDTNVERTNVTISAISDENAQTIIKGQLLSGYRGIVTFTPVRGRFNSALMSQYPQKVIDICHQYGYFAKISDNNPQTVECDMRSKMANSPNTPKRDPNLKVDPNEKPLVTLSKPSSPSTNAIKSDISQILKVEVPWNSESDAESIIRSTLEGDFIGTIRFIPSIGLYSVISMKSYPEKIIELCKEYNFESYRKCGQIIECIKNKIQTSAPNQHIKEVSLPTKSKKAIEQAIRSNLESGYIGNLTFTNITTYGPRIQEICKEYLFQSKLENKSVHVTMTQRKCNELIVELPINDPKGLKHKLQKYLECGYVGKILIKQQKMELLEKVGQPQSIYPTFSQFSHVVCDICRIYNCTTTVDNNTESILTQLNPKIVDLTNVSNEDLENQVKKNLLEFKLGFMIFFVKDGVPDTKKKTELIVNLCKAEGFPAKQADFYSGRVICNSNKNGVKKIDSNPPKNILTISLPTFDPKAAEQIIMKQITGKFIGSLLFVPKNTLYNTSVMPDYPQRIVDICIENGYSASIINQRCQIVECKKES